MARNLSKSNAHFQKAVKRLPLGVASNFRYWGDDRTIYVKQGRGARIVDLDDNRYVDYRMGYGRSAGRCGGARGHGGRRRVRALHAA
jgi:glutamate-1-semialdehyde 2,1-aminomutase